MKSDPIVAEVRRVREARAAKYNYDLSAICADLKKKEKEIPIILPLNMGLNGQNLEPMEIILI